MKSYDYLIIGSGIMGLECARLLSSAVDRVAVIDSSEIGSGASRIAAGALLKRGSTRCFSKHRQLMRESIDRYAEWLQRLSSESKTQIPLFERDDYCIMLDRHARTRLEGRLKTEDSQDYEVLDGIPDFLSQLKPRDEFMLFKFLNEKYVDCSSLMDALVSLCTQKNVELIERADIDCVEVSEKSIEIHTRSMGRLKTENLITCTGSGSARMLNHLGMKANLHRVGGQMFIVPKWHDGDFSLHLDDQYFQIPVGEGILVGATTELDDTLGEKKWNGQQTLESEFQKILPEFKIPNASKNITGYRCKNKDVKPLVGFLRDKRISVNVGHYKSGISTAPRICELFVNGLLSGEMPDEFSDYDPYRNGGIVDAP